MSSWAWSLLLPLVALAAGFIPVFFCIFYWQHLLSKEVRQSPLTRDMLRSPGDSLRTKIDDLQGTVNAAMAAWMILPALICISHLVDSHYRDTPETWTRVISEFAVLSAGSLLIGRWMFKRFEELRRFHLGMQGELATGQELDQLMLEGCRVYHDIPIAHGNIDHVVVSRSGVFTVNTKMRGKPQQGPGRANVKVDYTRNKLQFPDYSFPIPNEQLQGEANWLSKRLSGAMGESIKAAPILAFPGWFIEERIGRGDVCIINPTNAKKFFVNSRNVFSDTQISQIAHHLEQLCRDVRPGFQNNTRWEDKR
ncbi:nuclease-related domain-containing protein [Rosistilla oblonga]|uniref:nuclease-related domain-containing protein n=1 Tax=Rosistilla oblonga TaxID=2527990 RepID=UPI003A97117D